MTRPLLVGLTAALCAAAALRAELPRYSVTPIAGTNNRALNDQGEIMRYEPDQDGTTGLYLYDATSGARVGQLPALPVEWDRFGFKSSGLSNDATVALEIFKEISPGAYASEMTLSNLQTGEIKILAGTPANGDDDRNQRISPDGRQVVIQAGEDRSQLEPYRYQEGVGWQPLGNLIEGGEGRAFGVNDSGTVVGRTRNDISLARTVPFIYTDAEGMRAITDNGAPIYGDASAINDTGLVTGTAGGRAFVFDSETMELTYLTEEITGWQARDINEAGAVIGSNGLSGGGGLGVPSGSAFYWDDSMDSATSLENLIGDAINEWFITDAIDINNGGWILATGFQRSDQTHHQVLLRPIPEPTTTLLMLCAVAAAWRRRRDGQGKECCVVTT